MEYSRHLVVEFGISTFSEECIHSNGKIQTFREAIEEYSVRQNLLICFLRIPTYLYNCHIQAPIEWLASVSLQRCLS